MEDKAIAYQRRMDREYFAKKFRDEFAPADPFEGSVLIDAADLEISELVAVYRAAKHLESTGYHAFSNTLILHRGHLGLTPVVRVNAKCADRCRFFDRPRREKMVAVCNLLYEFFFGNGKTFAKKRQEIVNANDPLLLEIFQQVEEALELTAREIEVIVDAKS